MVRQDRLDLGGELGRRALGDQHGRQALVAERGGIVEEQREVLTDVAQRRLKVVRDRAGERLEVAAGALELDRALADEALESHAGGDNLAMRDLEPRRALHERRELALIAM